MSEELCEFEIEVLMGMAGLMPSKPWGAAVSVALETLESRGLVALLAGGYILTEEGEKLAKVDDPDEWYADLAARMKDRAPA